MHQTCADAKMRPPPLFFSKKKVAHSPVAASYVSVPETVLGFNVSHWRALAEPSANKIEHTASQVPSWPLTARKFVTHWDFMDIPHASRMEETWEQDFDLPVLSTGMAHMVTIARDFEFVGGGFYSDTTSRAQVEAERAQDLAAAREGGGGGFTQGTGGGKTSWQDAGGRTAGGNAEGGGEERERPPPEVGQLMFVGPGQLVTRGSTVRVRVSHGADGFAAFLLPQ